MADLKYVEQDFKHLFVNLPCSLVVILFYVKLGFSTYGWKHLVTFLCWSIYIYSLDDWLDKTRPFPYYTIPLLVISFIFYPTITVMTLIGLLLINIRTLTGKNSFLMETIETFGEVFVFLPIYFEPLNVRFPEFYLGTWPVIFIIDHVHKLGHMESKNRKLSIFSSIFVLLVLITLVLLNGQSAMIFLIIVTVLLVGAIPVLKATDRRKGWLHFQIWQAYALPLLIYFVLFHQWGTRFYFFEDKIFR